MQHYVIAYDITDNRRRRQVAALLEGHGRRVNASVFEARLKKAVAKRLSSQLFDLIDPARDSVRIYPFCTNCTLKAWGLGEEPDPFYPAETIL